MYLFWGFGSVYCADISYSLRTNMPHGGGLAYIIASQGSIGRFMTRK